MNRLQLTGCVAGSTRLDDTAAKYRRRPVVSSDPKTQRAFVMMLRQIERLHNDSYTVIEGAEISRSIGGGFTVRMNGECFKKSGKTAGSVESVAVWIWQRLTASREVA